jgi:hypothetical protein
LSERRRRFGTIPFNCAIVYTIRKVPANYKGLKLNGTLEIVLCANGANLLGVNRHTICEGNGRGAVIVSSNEVSLVTNTEIKIGKFATQRWVNKCFEVFSIWEQP